MKRLMFVITLLVLNGVLIVWECAAAPTPTTEQQIHALFPKATRIGEPLDIAPVYPVYQLQALLGYVFQSQDLVNIPGFSGDNINLLIGLDTRGRIKGVQVLTHHEPIFLHGLGPEPLQQFIAQFRGADIRKRIIVDGAHHGENDTTLHIDGVTKATVSVIVISDTVLLSALNVARKTLSDFAQSPLAEPKQDNFIPNSFENLIAQGLILDWEITQAALNRALPIALANYNDATLDTQKSDTSHFYLAYLNSPVIGQNLLGEAEYQRLRQTLKPNQHAFLIMSKGFLDLVQADFKPGTVANRLSLAQNQLPLVLRDLNFFYEGVPETLLPYADNARIFTLDAQSGFNPGAETQLQLNLSLARNPILLDTLTLSTSYQLPNRLFNLVSPPEIAEPTPPWLRLWQSRMIEVVILIIGLATLTVTFFAQHTLTRYPRLFQRYRWTYLLFTLFFIGWYAQGQLSVVNIYPIVQSLWRGFDLNVYLMDPMLFLLWSFVFIGVFLFGRGVFCGWLCPFGVLQEIVGWVAKRFRIRQWRIPERLHRTLILLKYGILISLIGMSIQSLNRAEVLSEVEPFKTAITLHFIRDWPFVLYAVTLLSIGLWVNKFYCRYVCPLGGGLAILGAFPLLKWLTRRQECGSPCTLCHHKCDTKAIDTQGNIDYKECVQCLACIVYYNNDTLCPPLKRQAKSICVKQLA